MRKFLFLTVSSLAVSACSDGVSPTNLIEMAPTVAMSHVGELLPHLTTEDLCGGLSPCDAFDYDRDDNGSPDGILGIPGFCFLPPTVENHLSDPACSGDFVPGLNGVFKLA